MKNLSSAMKIRNNLNAITTPAHTASPRSNKAHSKAHDKIKPQKQDQKPKDSKPHLSDEEWQHCKDKNLCFNCGYPGHSGRDCSYPFNPNRVPPKDDQAKSQQAQAHSKKCARIQSLHADSPSDHDVLTTDESKSDSESEIERSSKRRKN